MEFVTSGNFKCAEFCRNDSFKMTLKLKESVVKSLDDLMNFSLHVDMLQKLFGNVTVNKRVVLTITVVSVIISDTSIHAVRNMGLVFVIPV